MAERLKWVDGWRAIAVALVVAAHAAGALGVVLPPPFSRIGTLGVFAFFLISGFVIGRLAFAERAATGSFDQGRFYLRRAARILPPFFAYLAVALGAGLVSLEGALRSATFTCNLALTGGGCSWFAAHTWSLAFEEQFYLIFPLLAFRKPHLLTWLAIPFFIAPLVVPISWLGRVGALQIWVLFALGVAMARYETPITTALQRLPALLYAAFWPAALMAMSLPISLAQTVAAAFVPVLVFLGLFGLSTSAGVRRLLGVWPLATLGLWSYSIYLWQQFFLAPNTLETGADLALALCLTLAAAMVSRFVIERPMARISARYRPPASST